MKHAGMWLPAVANGAEENSGCASELGERVSDGGRADTWDCARARARSLAEGAGGVLDARRATLCSATMSPRGQTSPLARDSATTLPRRVPPDVAEEGQGARRAGARESVLDAEEMITRQARFAHDRPLLNKLPDPARAPITQGMPLSARVPPMTKSKLLYSLTRSSRAGTCGAILK